MADAIREAHAIAAGRNDLLAEAAGVAAGFWAANPAGQTGVELMAAALLIWAGDPLDYQTAGGVGGGRDGAGRSCCTTDPRAKA